MADEKNIFTVELVHEKGYEFKVHFPNASFPDLLVDENPPLGQGHGPNPSAMIATGVANCLSASLLFCLSKSRVPVEGLRTVVSTEIVRNEKGRLRIGGIDVKIHLNVKEEDKGKYEKCLGLFEDFCVVTESIRKGIDVKVDVQTS